MKSLQVLIKLAKRRVDQQRSRVAKAQGPVSQLKQDIFELEVACQNEARLAKDDPMLAVAYGAYARVVRERIELLDEDLQKAELLLNQEQERLSQLFKEQKVLEVYKERRLLEYRQKQDQREQQHLDEVALRLTKLAHDSHK